MFFWPPVVVVWSGVQWCLFPSIMLMMFFLMFFFLFRLCACAIFAMQRALTRINHTVVLISGLILLIYYTTCFLTVRVIQVSVSLHV